MKNRAGLKKVTKAVRGKKGTVRRSYWVRSNNANASNKKPGLLVSKTAMGSAVRTGFVSGLAQYGAHQVLAHYKGPDSPQHRTLAKAVSVGSHIGSHALIAKHFGPQRPGQILKQRLGHYVGRTAGLLAGVGAHVMYAGAKYAYDTHREAQTPNHNVRVTNHSTVSGSSSSGTSVHVTWNNSGAPKSRPTRTTFRSVSDAEIVD